MPTSTSPNATLNLVVTPALTVVPTAGAPRTITESNTTGFSVELQTTVAYESLNQLLEVFVPGKKITLTEGLLRQELVLEGCKLYPGATDQIVVAEVPFSGSYRGTFYITGTPAYDAASKELDLQNVAYDLKTQSLILRGMKWLFGKLILEEIKKATSVSLTPFYQTIIARLTELLNKPWSTGITANGAVAAVEITSIVAHSQHLLLQARCSGALHLTLSEAAWKRT